VDHYRAESRAADAGLATNDAIGRALATPVIALVRLYRWTVSPLLGSTCRFEPSCSRFAETALARHGLARGVVLAVGRLLRCHPWGGPGGYDPVPGAGR
jgi:putative membrane protein insertion efficiency factor